MTNLSRLNFSSNVKCATPEPTDFVIPAVVFDKPPNVCDNNDAEPLPKPLTISSAFKCPGKSCLLANINNVAPANFSCCNIVNNSFLQS